MSAKVVKANLDDDVVIEETANPISTSRQVALSKNQDAKWVAGLRPERELSEAEQRKLRMEELKKRQLDANPWSGKGHWLSRPMNYGLLAIMVILFRLTFTSIPGGYSLGATYHHDQLAPKEDFYLQLEFPPEEVPAWKLVKAMVPLDYVVLASYPIISAIFVGNLCLNFAVATESFVMFIGVGFAVVGSLAEIGDLITLHAACFGKNPVPGDNQCFLPITLHWILATFATVFPIIGMMTVSYVFDDILKYRVDMKDDWWEMKPYWRRFNKWFWITSAPFGIHFLHWADCYWFGRAPQHKNIKLAMVVQVIVWCAVLRRCYNQKPFVVHWEDPREVEAVKGKTAPKIVLPTVGEVRDKMNKKKND